ncbi:MAG: hypothetical protein HUU29_14040 [Planctomycetaceae bacterium]|nr:hypothetical protein [Planctomycetaceae bacterium]
MAGLVTNNSSATGLDAFILGTSAAAKVGAQIGVTQLRNNLVYDYGDMLSGAANDGTIYNIRINERGDYEFGDNLSHGKQKGLPNNVIDAGDVLSMPTTIPLRYLEQRDVAHLAHALLLFSKGEITEEQINTDPAFKNFYVLDVVDAADRMNLEIGSRTFTINGVKMEYSNDRFRILSRPGQGAVSGRSRDPELEAIRRKISNKEETLLGGKEDVETVDAAEMSIGELIGVREDLEEKYQFVAYNFADSQFVGSDSFDGIVNALATIPDGFFFGANMAFQLQDKFGDDISNGAKNELFAVTLNYFANLAVGAMTGLPSQLRSEFEKHATDILTGTIGDEDQAKSIIDTIRPDFEETVQNVMDAVANIAQGAEVEELREGLGIRSSRESLTYTVRKYTSRF